MRFSLRLFMIVLVFISVVFALVYQWTSQSKREYARKQASLSRVGELFGGVLYDPSSKTNNLDPYDIGDLLELHFEGTLVKNDDLRHARVLEPSRLLSLQNTMISDRGLVHLYGIQIQTIDLTNTSVSTEGIADLKSNLPGSTTIIHSKSTDQ